LIYSILDGIILGTMVLNEFVFVKSIKGSELQLAVLLQFSMIVFIFSLISYEVLKKYKKRKVLILTAFITRLPLLIFFWFPKDLNNIDNLSFYHNLFLLIFLFYYISLPVINPIINSILKNNYNDKHFGKLYSYATSINKIVMLIVTFAFGVLMDYDNFAFIWIYPIIGTLGIISLTILSKAVKVDYLDGTKQIVSIKNVLKHSISEFKYIIKTNKAFRDFEIGFFLYGFAFMTTAPIITLFLAEKLKLNYSSIAFYKNSYNIIAILLLPFFGKLLDRIDPRKFAAFTFFTLLMHLLFMGLTEYFPYYYDIGNYRFYYLLIISFTWNGLFAATMTLLWNIGSAYFSENSLAGKYQSIHLSLVGLRGMFAPLFGVWLYYNIDFSGVFLLGLLFLIMAISVVNRSLALKKV